MNPFLSLFLVIFSLTVGIKFTVRHLIPCQDIHPSRLRPSGYIRELLDDIWIPCENKSPARLRPSGYIEELLEVWEPRQGCWPKLPCEQSTPYAHIPPYSLPMEKNSKK